MGYKRKHKLISKWKKEKWDIDPQVDKRFEGKRRTRACYDSEGPPSPPAFNACLTVCLYCLFFFLQILPLFSCTLYKFQTIFVFALIYLPIYRHGNSIWRITSGREVMSCSVRSGFEIVICFFLLLFSSNVVCASVHRLGSHKHHHKVASLVQDVVHGGGRRRVLGGAETGEEVVVMDYPQPHRKPPIHNEKA